VDYELTRLGRALVEPVSEFGSWARRNRAAIVVPQFFGGAALRVCQESDLTAEGRLLIWIMEYVRQVRLIAQIEIVDDPEPRGSSSNIVHAGSDLTRSMNCRAVALADAHRFVFRRYFAVHCAKSRCGFVVILTFPYPRIFRSAGWHCVCCWSTDRREHACSPAPILQRF